jgi:hypothetical protein
MRWSSPLHRSGLWFCLIAAALQVGGCASPGRVGSPDDQLQAEQSDSFVRDNTVGGAGMGSVIGCVAGTLLDVLLIVAVHVPLPPGIGCGAGAVAGGIAGGVDGYRQGQEAQAQANQILLTRLMTDEIRKHNEELRSAVEAAEVILEGDQEKLAQIRSALAAKTITLDNAKAEAALIRNDSNRIFAVVDGAAKNRDDFLAARRKLRGADTAALDQQIAQLNGQIAELETRLAAVNSSLALTGLD